MDANNAIPTNRRDEMSDARKQDEVTSTWIGQDGNEWRELRCWVGNGYRYFTQKHVGGRLWV
jgi:hypothetical protein